MKKKLTLNQTWKYCLQLWKYVFTRRKKDKTADVDDLKDEWFEKHPQFEGIESACFFCEYVDRREQECQKDCPGKLVSKRFNCCARTYHYRHNPLKFYRKLVELNKKRKR